tara:strand:+ start:816 stop:1163 length:348 start_codon:yes stop_codon:yes gene_type:complete
MTEQVEFGVILRKTDYVKDCVDGFTLNLEETLHPAELRDRYEQFIGDFLSGKITKSTLVDVDVLETFCGDLHHRGVLDEGTEDDYKPDMNDVKGGKYFRKISEQLSERLGLELHL